VNEEEHEVAAGDDGMEEVLLQVLEPHGDKYGNNDDMISSYDSRSIPKTTMDIISSTNATVIIIISHHTTTWAFTQIVPHASPNRAPHLWHIDEIRSFHFFGHHGQADGSRPPDLDLYMALASAMYWIGLEPTRDRPDHADDWIRLFIYETN
ncbi:hypothetical protein KI387_006441, partial [Taxus chinensis]